MIFRDFRMDCVCILSFCHLRTSLEKRNYVLNLFYMCIILTLSS